MNDEHRCPTIMHHAKYISTITCIFTRIGFLTTAEGLRWREELLSLEPGGESGFKTLSGGGGGAVVSGGVVSGSIHTIPSSRRGGRVSAHLKK